MVFRNVHLWESSKIACWKIPPIMEAISTPKNVGRPEVRTLSCWPGDFVSESLLGILLVSDFGQDFSTKSCWGNLCKIFQ